MNLNKPKLMIFDPHSFQSGEVYLFHTTKPHCPAISSLWGVVSSAENGTILLESGTLDLLTFTHWQPLDPRYRYWRRASRAELRDYISNLIYHETRRA